MTEIKNEIQKGIVVRLVPARGFGFVRTPDSDENLFFHCTGMLDPDQFKTLRGGQLITFEPSVKKGKTLIKNITAIMDTENSNDILAYKTGIICRLDFQRNFGFVTQVGRDDSDIFFHETSLLYPQNFNELRVGMNVKFMEVETGSKPFHRHRAIGIRLKENHETDPGREFGTIKEINEPGYGFLVPDNGINSLYFHYSGCLEPFDKFQSGQRISFLKIMGIKGIYAAGIMPVTSENEGGRYNDN